MELTKRQVEGLNIAIERYKKKEKYTCIAGYAGSGKTTLVKFIISALQIPEELVCYAAFTGKAAQVLLKKGNKNVSTLHRLLYTSILQPDGSYIRKPVEKIPYQVVVVDEISMVPKTLINLLFNYGCYIICLGDPFQLPPIDKSEDNHLLDTPHVFLDEIMRQAQESEIIRVSMDIREGKPLELMNGQDVKIFDHNDLVEGMYLWADQILCATNSTRVAVNNDVRRLLGREGSPQTGDKVICLKNYWNKTAMNEDPLINGTIGTIHYPYQTFNRYPYFIQGGGSIDITRATFISDSDANFGNIDMDTKMILEGVRGLDWKVEYALLKSRKLQNMVPKEFTYGYAITCHKAQGSQWDKVLVMEEGFPYSKEEHTRWLYTACTRASEKLVIIRK